MLGGGLKHGLAMEYPPCWGLQTHGPCHTCRIYRATCTTPCLSHFLRLYLLPFDSEPCENSGLPAAQKRSDICLKKHKRQGRTETWTSVLTDHKSPHKFDVIMNGFFFPLFFFFTWRTFRKEEGCCHSCVPTNPHFKATTEERARSSSCLPSEA